MPRDATLPTKPARAPAPPGAKLAQRASGAIKPARDAERTRAAILAAATDDFAKHGLDGARVDRIAAQAKANKRMLYYYFGDKDALFLAVLEAAYARIRGDEQKLDLKALAPEAGMRELVVFTWNYFLAHPEFISLLNTENLHRAKHLKRSAAIRKLHSPLVATIGDLLERGRRDGVFRGGVDPVQLYVSIAALGYFYLSNAYTLSTIFDRALLAPAAKRERLAHIVDLVLRSLAPVTARPTPSHHPSQGERRRH